MRNQTVKVAELFAGVGGFHLGLARASDNFQVVWANQFEPSRKHQFAYDIYYDRFKQVIPRPDINISCVDITKVNKKTDIPDINMVVGGFPCQDYSVASSNARGLYGKKGVLWWDVRSVIEAKWPQYVFLENVDRLLSSPGVTKSQPGRDFGMILRTLEDLDYCVSWKVINAADYGFPQKRRRIFIFAARRDTKYFRDMKRSVLKDESTRRSYLESMSPFSKTLKVDRLGKIQPVNLMKNDSMDEFSTTFSLKGGFKKTGVMIGGQVFMADYQALKRQQMNLGSLLRPNEPDQSLYIDKGTEKYLKFETLKKGFHTTKVSATGFEYKYGMGAIPFPDRLDLPARTMLTSEHTISRTSHLVIDPGNGRPRLLSPEETELINTFQVGWTDLPGISKPERYFTMGNSLVVNLVKEISESIDEIAQNEDSFDKAYQPVKYHHISH